MARYYNGIKMLESVPKGFRLVEGATTAPIGYRLYCDRPVHISRFDREWQERHGPTRHVLVRDKRKKEDYKEGFNILMEYWDSLPDEEKPEIDERLKKVGL